VSSRLFRESWLIEGVAVLSVFLVDDHEVVRRGVADLLDEEVDLIVVGQASTVSEALARDTGVAPGRGGVGRAAAGWQRCGVVPRVEIVAAELNCLMLTSYTDEQAMLEVILAGAGGYVIKDIKGMELVSAVRTVGGVDPCWTTGPRRR
jgi:DNA-binding NarL/FixJ family response regulator